MRNRRPKIGAISRQYVQADFRLTPIQTFDGHSTIQIPSVGFATAAKGSLRRGHDLGRVKQLLEQETDYDEDLSTMW
jgi:hypothetical protein